MSYSSKHTEPLRVSDTLGETLIRQDSFISEETYHPEISFADLYTHRVIEISMVASGNGIHRVFNQAIPCKVGDIYILNANVPHRYFAAERGERLTVRRLLFDPKDWFDRDIALPTGSRFCYGVFSENSMAAYAMLTQRVLERIESLCDEVAMAGRHPRPSFPHPHNPGAVRQPHHQEYSLRGVLGMESGFRRHDLGHGEL